MCQMCEEYEAELRRLGIAMDEKVIVDFEPATFEALSRQAEAHGHDVVAEVREIVRRDVGNGVPKPRLTGLAAIEAARRIQAMTPKGVSQTPAWKIIRDSRDHDH